MDSRGNERLEMHFVSGCHAIERELSEHSKIFLVISVPVLTFRTRCRCILCGAVATTDERS
jgi:hypothetical protein